MGDSIHVIPSPLAEAYKVFWPTNTTASTLIPQKMACLGDAQPPETSAAEKDETTAPWAEEELREVVLKAEKLMSRQPMIKAMRSLNTFKTGRIAQVWFRYGNNLFIL